LLSGLAKSANRKSPACSMQKPARKQWRPARRPRYRGGRAQRTSPRKRKFHDVDLANCFLVVAATSSSKLHKRILRLAKRLGVLCNVVDVPELCDFYYPAVVRRGALQVAISTGGESPALAQRLRKELESQFGPEYADWVAELGKVRKRIRNGSTQATDQKKTATRIGN
jgi:siroheme synthase-like protein